jgi:hypothetical protein
MNEWRKYGDEQWLRLAKGVDEEVLRALRRPSGFGRLLRFALGIAPLLAVAASLEGPAAIGRPVKAAGGEMEIEMNVASTALATLAVIGCGSAYAQSIQFSRTTDTVRLTQDVPPSAAITIEARLWIETHSNSWGFEHALWREQKNSFEDKGVYICSLGVRMYLAGTTDLVSWDGGLPLGRWVHIACQQSSGFARIWVDGVLKQEVASTSNTIWSVPGSSNSIGAGFHNDSFVVPGALCKIDWLRVSTCARYGSGNFTPPSECEILPTDSCTALLFTFDEPTDSPTLVNRGFVQGVATVGANWIPDATSPVLAGSSADANGNGLPDTCEPQPCSGDVDNSGSVGGVDLAIVLTNWGTPSAKYPGADTNGDGLVDGTDLATVLAGWGACP